MDRPSSRTPAGRAGIRWHFGKHFNMLLAPLGPGTTSRSWRVLSSKFRIREAAVDCAAIRSHHRDLVLISWKPPPLIDEIRSQMAFVPTMKKALLAAALLLGGLAVYALAARQLGAPAPPAMAAPGLQADLVVVNKTGRIMQLFRNGRIIREYRISLGGQPIGHKQHEGDKRTPEGHYIIDWRNSKSSAYLSLHISYPAPADIARAAAAGQAPGGNIMIHGLANGWGLVGSLHLLWDWTDGCIAVTNDEMRQIWSIVPDGTPIEING
jgi:L,D-transpeptidase catalytic domain